MFFSLVSAPGSTVWKLFFFFCDMLKLRRGGDTGDQTPNEKYSLLVCECVCVGAGWGGVGVCVGDVRACACVLFGFSHWGWVPPGSEPPPPPNSGHQSRGTHPKILGDLPLPLFVKARVTTGVTFLLS